MALVLLVLGVVAVMRTSMSEDYRGLANFEGLPAASEFAGLHGVAAVRAADAAVSAAWPAAASSLSGVRGVAAVRAADAAVSAARPAAASSLSGLRGVAAVRAADAAASAAASK